MNILSARNPVYANQEHTAIDLFVTFEGIGEVPFTAHPNDEEAHGRDIYIRAVQGEFGAVAPYVVPVKTPEQIRKELENAVQSFMDSKAQAKGYDNIKSAALRAGYPGPFHDEGVIYATWMDSCWSTCYAIMADVQARTRQVPTVAELIAALPVFTLVP